MGSQGAQIVSHPSPTTPYHSLLSSSPIGSTIIDQSRSDSTFSIRHLTPRRSQGVIHEGTGFNSRDGGGWTGGNDIVCWILCLWWEGEDRERCRAGQRDNGSMDGIDWTILQVLECHKVNCRKSKSQIITPSQLVPTNRCASAVTRRVIVPFTRCLCPTRSDIFTRSLCSPASRSASPTCKDSVRPRRIPSPTPDLSAFQSPLRQSDNERSIASAKIPNPILTSPHSLTRRGDPNRTFQAHCRMDNSTPTAPSKSSKPRPDWDARAGR